MMEANERPWGSWRVVHNDGSTVVKILSVNPGCMLSLQSHKGRSEYWQPLDDGLVAYVYSPARPLDPDAALGGTRSALLLSPFRTFYVPVGQVHRLMNPTTKPISLVETIVGRYDEEDIKRYHDAYGRT